MTYKLAIAVTAALALAACNAGGGSTSAGQAGEPASGAPAASAPAASADTSASVGPSGMPRQRPGQWRMAVNFAEGVPPLVRDVCITEQEAADPASLAGARGDAQCRATEWRRDGDAMVGVSTCRVGGQDTTTRVRVTGDPRSRYTVETSTDGAGPAATVRIEATWLGACPA